MRRVAKQEIDGEERELEVLQPSMYLGIEVQRDLLGNVIDSTGFSVSNIYLNGVRIAGLMSNLDARYFHTDQVDSVKAVTNASGLVLTSHEYKPFGEDWVTEGDDKNAPKYNSQELDKESGYLFYNARHYDPEIARFVTPDTVIPRENDSQSWNRFAYCSNNPIIYKDPSGHEDIIVTGGYSGKENDKTKFIESSIKAIKDLKEKNVKENNGESTTWAVAKSGYTASEIKHMKKIAEKLDVKFLPFDNKDQLIEHINNSPGRGADLISDIHVYSHGQPGKIALAYGQSKEKQKALDIDSSDISRLDPKSFKENLVSELYPCGAGTGGKDSFAQKWVNHLGGKTKAVVNSEDPKKYAQTSYFHIYDDQSDDKRRDRAIQKYFGRGFSKDGAGNYPEPSTNPPAKFMWFEKK